MKIKARWIAWLMVMTMCLFGFTACGDSGSTDEEESATVVTDPVKITCDNGVMLGQTIDGVTSFKGVPYANRRSEICAGRRRKHRIRAMRKLNATISDILRCSTSGLPSRRHHSQRMKTV